MLSTLRVSDHLGHMSLHSIYVVIDPKTLNGSSSGIEGQYQSHTQITIPTRFHDFCTPPKHGRFRFRSHVILHILLPEILQALGDRSYIISTIPMQKPRSPVDNASALLSSTVAVPSSFFQPAGHPLVPKQRQKMYLMGTSI